MPKRTAVLSCLGSLFLGVIVGYALPRPEEASPPIKLIEDPALVPVEAKTVTHSPDGAPPPLVPAAGIE